MTKNRVDNKLFLKRKMHKK